MTEPPATPPTTTDLGPAGLALWAEVQAAYELDPGEERVLAEACRTVDELEGLQAALRAGSVVVRGSTRQDRPNPLFAEIRLHRASLAALVKAITPKPEGDQRTISQKRSDAAPGRYGKVSRVK